MGLANRRPARRDVLRFGTAATAMLAVPGCDLLSTDPEGGGGGASSKSGAKEAPDLAALVKDGKLPPLKQRLPKEPLEVQPTDRIGRYGGQWDTFLTSVAADPHLVGCLSYEPLVRWNIESTGVVPGIAKEWDVSEDTREYTFHLRADMKWSDGEPFGVDDIVFAYEDVQKNKDLFPVFTTWLTTARQPATLEKIDDVTFKFVFAEPNGIFLENIAASGTVLTSLPRHYLEKFHPKYNPDAESLAKDEGFANWMELFGARGGLGPGNLGSWQNPELPTVYPWRIVQGIGEGNRLVAERNPFYWKTDPNGAQLPYLDKVVMEIVEEPNVSTLQITEGRYSVITPGIATLQSKPVFARGRQAGGYHFVDMVEDRMNFGTFVLNHNHKDPAMRAVFQNKDFKIGLSYALNRKEIVSLIMKGQGEPWNTSPRPESKYFYEPLGTQYTEYDLDKANEHLDLAGYSQRDDEGFRLRDDGKRLGFNLQVRVNFNPAWADIAELAGRYWREVGVDARVEVVAAELIFARIDANDHEAIMDDGDGGLIPYLNPGWYLPAAGSSMAIRWAQWYDSGGAEGEEPPAPQKRQMELFDQVKATLDEAERVELFTEILKIAAEEFYVIGTARTTQQYNIVQNDFHNVPDPFLDGSSYPEPGPTNPEQYFRE
ncbi:ABC transporter substrate-binding protein [Actinopolymorpha sp. B17G11]|uniref:ABC transporter substrate-binding protein n=1 Tax=Actinopolymorpha sp. B17G11 TaxID=3160861 RepID=UPI0032E37479